jgi:predicted nucleotidyltransferase
MTPMSANRLQSALPEIVRRLRQALEPAAIYLYGSVAYGEPGADSDVDLLVIVPESELTFHQRSALAYRALRGIGIPIDVQVYTRAEFESRAALPVSFERTVSTRGRILYAA